MGNKNLLKQANAMLRRSGYASDGSTLRSVSTEQRVFDRFTVIKTPMGNRR